MTIDGKLCLLYLGGLSLGFGFSRCSLSCASASVVWPHETEQKLDKNPLADAVSCSAFCSCCFSPSVAWLTEAHRMKDRNPIVKAVFCMRTAGTRREGLLLHYLVGKIQGGNRAK